MLRRKPSFFRDSSLTVSRHLNFTGLEGARLLLHTSRARPWGKVGGREVGTDVYLFECILRKLSKNIPIIESNCLNNILSSSEINYIYRCELQLDATTELEEEQFKDKRWILFAEYFPKLKFCLMHIPILPIFQIGCIWQEEARRSNILWHFDKVTLGKIDIRSILYPINMNWKATLIISIAWQMFLLWTLLTLRRTSALYGM